MIPPDKGKANKNEISNERVIKDQIVCGMEKDFSAYKKNYSSQNILISLIEEWRKNMGNDFAVGAALTDLSKAFDCIPHHMLIAKLSAYDFSFVLYLFIPDKSQIVRPYKQHTQSARDYNSGCSTVNPFWDRLFSTYQ